MKNIVSLKTKPCLVCGKEGYVDVYYEDVTRYINGAKVQDAFPYLPAEQREMIISGTHPACFNEIFPPEEEY